MSGFLDPYAVSIKAEYTRYLDADLLGKIIFKNFALNVLGVDEESVRIPLSRHGDLGTYKDLSDAGIRFENRSYSVEQKSLDGVCKSVTKLIQYRAGHLAV